MPVSRLEARLIERLPFLAKRPALVELARFCVVGALGVVVDSTVLVAGVELGGLDPRIAIFPAFAAAVSFNYALNRAWTYGDRQVASSRVAGWLLFVVICAVGAALRSLLMDLLLDLEPFAGGFGYVAANLVGIVAVTLFNFAATRAVVFRRRS